MAKKMLLVPSDSYEKNIKTTYALPHPVLSNVKTTKLLTLDGQLKDTLQNPNFDSDMKARLYQDLLRDFLNIKKSVSTEGLEPHGVKEEAVKHDTIRNATHNVTHDVKPQLPQTDLEDKLLENIPLKHYNHAEALLRKLNYSKTGELINSNGDLIPGSDVNRLLRGHFSSSQRARTKTRKLLGYSSFKTQIGQGVNHVRWSSF